MKYSMLLGVNTLCNFYIRYELRYILYDLINLLSDFPVLLYNVTEKVSSIVERWLTKRSQAKYLWLVEWKLLVE